MKIDTHVHFWHFDPVRDSWINQDMAILRQDYIPEKIQSTLQLHGIDGYVAVQADQSEAETNFLIGLAEKHTEIKGVVGWVDLCSENVEERLAFYSKHKIIKGWRHILQAEPDDFMMRADFHRGISALAQHDYTYDVLVYHHQLKTAVEFVSKFPNQQFVIDHCAKPGIAAGKIHTWKSHMKTLADHPNVFCKVSGLFTEAVWSKWTASDVYPYLDVVFDLFGTQRLMFGSDWPVILLAGTYTQWKYLLLDYMKDIREEEIALVFGDTARSFYKL
jgi:L-fuconolactonase